MSTSWSSPDPRRIATGNPFGAVVPPVDRPLVLVRHDVLAGLLTAAVTILVGAPVGLLWAALAPRAEAVRSGEVYLRADPSSSAYIAGDGFFLFAVLLAGLVTGLLAWRFGRDHGPTVVVGLAVGGMLAALVAMRVGEQVGVAAIRAAVRAGQASVEINLELMARAALTGWPVAALVGFLVPTLIAGEDRAVPVSSG